MQVLDNKNNMMGRRAFSRERRKKRPPLFENDDVYNICHVGGTLILCDYFPSSFRLECIQMEVCDASCNNFNISHIYFGWIIVFYYQSHCTAWNVSSSCVFLQLIGLGWCIIFSQEDNTMMFVVAWHTEVLGLCICFLVSKWNYLM